MRYYTVSIKGYYIVIYVYKDHQWLTNKRDTYKYLLNRYIVVIVC